MNDRTSNLRVSDDEISKFIVFLERSDARAAGLGPIFDRIGLALKELSNRRAFETDELQRWRWAEANMNYSFNGEDRTYYLKAKGRESFAEAIDRRRAEKTPEWRCSCGEPLPESTAVCRKCFPEGIGGTDPTANGDAS